MVKWTFWEPQGRPLQKKKLSNAKRGVQGLSGRHPHWLGKVLGCLNRASLGSGGGVLLVPAQFGTPDPDFDI